MDVECDWQPYVPFTIKGEDLLPYFCSIEFASSAGKDLKGEKHRVRKQLARTQAFASAALRDSGSVAAGGRLPMQALVRKLQALPSHDPLARPQTTASSLLICWLPVAACTCLPNACLQLTD